MTTVTNNQHIVSGDGAVANDIAQPAEHLHLTEINTPSLKPPQDITSDNEASEGPVREKLKKTSIASIPRQTDASRADEDEAQITPTIAQVLENDAQAVTETLDMTQDDRGRPVRKRSFDDLRNDKVAQPENGFQEIGSISGRERKRSKDVHDSRDHQDSTAPRHPAAVVPEGQGDKLPPSTDTEPADEDMTHGAFSPRKKRSRDHMDMDTHREQKIPATEEAKAYRRSDEQERKEKPMDDVQESGEGGTSKKPGEAIGAGNAFKVVDENISTSGFGNTSKISPFSSLSSAETFPKASTVLGATGDQKLQAPAHNLASSTFESSSQASGSPFGTLGPTPFGGGKSFGSGAFAGNETAGGGWRGNDSAQATTNGFSTSSTTSVSQNANVMAPSPFGGASGSSQGTSFGGNSIFGTGFGQNSGIGGAKLSSFADPKGGDMTLGKPSAIKPIGATKGSDDEGSNSEGEGEDVQAEEVEDEERDPRFQYQQRDTGEEGEESKFSSSRAKLYGWEGGAWKERGAGVFKFNVSDSASAGTTSGQKRARFIMRAHQTYRILLNTPVFKQMTIGDPVRQGQEPTGKSISTAVVMDDGRPMPYLIRLSDNNEAKTLYREVRELQEQL